MLRFWRAAAQDARLAGQQHDQPHRSYKACQTLKHRMAEIAGVVGMERSLLVPGCPCKWLSPERISKEGLRWSVATREPQVLLGRRGSLFLLNMTLALL